jgi:hypothetical protein
MITLPVFYAPINLKVTEAAAKIAASVPAPQPCLYVYLNSSIWFSPLNYPVPVLHIFCAGTLPACPREM